MRMHAYVDVRSCLSVPRNAIESTRYQPGLVVVLNGHDPKSTSALARARAGAAAAAERYAREQLVELCA